MVYGRSQLVALAVGGGGAIVAAAVLGYLLKRYRDSSTPSTPTPVDDAIELSSAAADSLELPTDRPPSSNEAEPKSSSSSTTSSVEDEDLRSTLLERPLDFARISRSSGIAEVESPSFEDLLAIEDEVLDEIVEEGISSEPEVAVCQVHSIGSRESDETKLPSAETEDNGVDATTKRIPLNIPEELANIKSQMSPGDGESADEVFAENQDAANNNDSFSTDSEKTRAIVSPSGKETDGDILKAATSFKFSPLPAVVTENSTSAANRLPALVMDNSFSTSQHLPTPDSPSSISPPSRSRSRASSRCSTTLDDIEEQTTVLSPSESRALVGFLNSANTDVIRRALFIAANAADFPANRYFLRRAGSIPVLNRFLSSSTEDDLIELSEKALGNLAVDDANIEYMGDSVEPLIKNVSERKDRVPIQLEALKALANLSRKALLHHHFLASFVDELLGRVDDPIPSLDLRLESLKILANLSVNAVVAPDILSARSLSGLTKWLSLAPTGKPQQDASELTLALGVCDLLSNLLEAAFPADDAKASAVRESLLVAVEREDTLLGSIASDVKAVTFRSLLFDLNRHPEHDVRFQGKRLYALLAPLWRKFKSSSEKIIEEEN